VSTDPLTLGLLTAIMLAMLFTAWWIEYQSTKLEAELIRDLFEIFRRWNK